MICSDGTAWGFSISLEEYLLEFIAIRVIRFWENLVLELRAISEKKSHERRLRRACDLR